MQHLEQVDVTKVRTSAAASNINWCSSANEWGDECSMFTGEDAENCNEQNGNVIKNDNNRYNF